MRHARDADALITVGGIEAHRDAVAALRARAAAYLKRHHRTHPGEPGMPVERLIGWIDHRARPGVGRDVCDQLTRGGETVMRGPFVAHQSFLPALSPEEARLLASIRDELDAAGLDPPAWEKLAAVAGLPRARQNKLMELMRGDPSFVRVAPQVFATRAALDAFRTQIDQLGAGGRRFKLADVRDALGLSRRVVQPLLEYLDRENVTRRVGDERELVSLADR
jgi:selenocysteine-specific elongation factor